MSKLIFIHGSPGTGKSVLATDVYSTLSKKGNSVHYVQEYIKDLANRKYVIDPMDQIGIFGNQTMLINGAVQAKYDFISCCSSPLLCSFYANYYSNNSFTSLVGVSNSWMDYLKEKFDVEIHNFFMFLEKDEYVSRFKQNGRYEDIEDSLNLQDAMLQFYEKNYPQFTMIDHTYNETDILSGIYEK